MQWKNNRQTGPENYAKKQVNNVVYNVSLLFQEYEWLKKPEFREEKF